MDLTQKNIALAQEKTNESILHSQVPKDFEIFLNLPRKMRGRLYEFMVCYTQNYAMFNYLPLNLKKRLNSSERCFDCGIDFVEFCENDEMSDLSQEKRILNIGQIKCYASPLSQTSVMKLNSLATLIEKNTNIKIKEKIFVTLDLNGNEFTSNIPGIDEITKIRISLIDIFRQYWEKRSNSSSFQRVEEITLIPDDILRNLNNVQNDALLFIEECFSNKKECVVQLPCGSGKSHIIEKLILLHPSSTFLIVVPRVEIVKGLKSILRNKINENEISTLYSGRELVKRRILVTTYHSLFKLTSLLPSEDGSEAEFDYLIRDESHLSYNTSKVKCKKILKLSACFYADERVDYTLSIEKSLSLRIIARPIFEYAIFEKKPSFHSVGKYLFNLKEEKILLNFTSQEDAKDFCRYYSSHFHSEIGCFTSDYENEYDGECNDLLLFKENQIRILAHVSRLEIGINLPTITTVAFYDVWASKNRMHQIINRGCRLHPSKLSYSPEGELNSHSFKVLNFFGGDISELAESVKSFREIVYLEVPEIAEEEFYVVNADKPKVSANPYIEEEKVNEFNQKVKFIEKILYTCEGKRISEIDKLRKNFEFDVSFLKEKLLNRTQRGYYSLRKEFSHLPLNPEEFYSQIRDEISLNFWDIFLSRRINEYLLKDEFMTKINDEISNLPKNFKLDLLNYSLILENEDLKERIPLNPLEFYNVKSFDDFIEK